MKWFSLSGIQSEIKRIRWPKAKELGANSMTVIGFTIAFGIFFVACDFISAAFFEVSWNVGE